MPDVDYLCSIPNHQQAFIDSLLPKWLPVRRLNMFLLGRKPLKAPVVWSFRGQQTIIAFQTRELAEYCLSLCEQPHFRRAEIFSDKEAPSRFPSIDKIGPLILLSSFEQIDALFRNCPVPADFPSPVRSPWHRLAKSPR